MLLISSAAAGWGGEVGIGAVGNDENELAACPDTKLPKSTTASEIKRFIMKDGGIKEQKWTAVELDV